MLAAAAVFCVCARVHVHACVWRSMHARVCTCVCVLACVGGRGGAGGRGSGARGLALRVRRRHTHHTAPSCMKLMLLHLPAKAFASRPVGDCHAQHQHSPGGFASPPCRPCCFLAHATNVCTARHPHDAGLEHTPDCPGLPPKSAAVRAVVSPLLHVGLLQGLPAERTAPARW